MMEHFGVDFEHMLETRVDPVDVGPENQGAQTPDEQPVEKGEEASETKKKRKRVWCRKQFEDRVYFKSIDKLSPKMQAKSAADFQKNTNVSVAVFKYLLKKIDPFIAREDTLLRMSIPSGARLEITLRFLANGGTYRTLEDLSNLSKSSLSCLVPETCDAIYQILKDDYMKIPNNSEEWQNVAKEFETKCHFPHCVGALAGRHLTIMQGNFKEFGTRFKNFQGLNSFAIVALVNANYEFMCMDVGSEGRVFPGGVWGNSPICSGIAEATLALPQDQLLPKSSRKLPFVFAADEQFPLKKHLMTPYVYANDRERIFSYRLSRVNRVSENAFGVLEEKFRILKAPIKLHVNTIEKIILACAVLHNFLIRETKCDYAPRGTIDLEVPTESSLTPGSWRTSLHLMPIEEVEDHSVSSKAAQVREEYTEYFNEEGALSWQQNMCEISELAACQSPVGDATET